MRLDVLRNTNPVVPDEDRSARYDLLPMRVHALSLRLDADMHLTAGARRFGGIRDEIGEDLPQLSREGRNGDGCGKLGGDGDAQVNEAPIHEKKNLLQHLAKVNGDR